ncbi:flagellar protein FlgN [Sedimentibacter sp. zth1]|uniref:flagellar protein FlgN n=1 Tax=Sedimentibacter sp. zth1 TaxID=2816908 RepID=UPI001A91CD29|nr:flagellar protein FlgN [Sedimentibacter sp. zth1]QSX06024.1 flagellar protein FlgN [Sedimentibacter sp. zth1]
MNKFDVLYDILLQQLKLYESFLILENKKYDVIINDNVEDLDKIVSEEQVFFLKSRGLDLKREDILKQLGMANKTLLEVVSLIDENEKHRFKEMHAKIYKVLADFKEKNTQCQELTQIRLHRVKTIINKLEESKSQSKQYFKDGNKGEVDINKVNLISKKI